MEKRKIEVNTIFNLYDKSHLENPNLVRTNTPLEEYGQFCNLVLPTLVSFIKVAKNYPNSIEQARTRCVQTLSQLMSKIEGAEDLSQICVESLGLIEKYTTDSELVLEKLQSIISQIFLIFEARMKRERATLNISIGQQNKTRDVVQAQTSIENYITKQMQLMHLSEGLEEYDPLLIHRDACGDFLDYLYAHQVSFPRCPCQKAATWFAFPCNCGVACDKCGWDPNHPLICPNCGKEVKEFVHVEP